MFNTIESWNLSIHHFNILFDEMGRLQNALLLDTKVWWWSGYKELVQLDSKAEVASLSWNGILFEIIKNKLWLLDMNIW